MLRAYAPNAPKRPLTRLVRDLYAPCTCLVRALRALKRILRALERVLRTLERTLRALRFILYLIYNM